MKLISSRTLLLILLFIIYSSPVYAWGPSVHYFLGHRILELGLISGTLGRIISKHRDRFLYGNVVADVVFGKNMVDIEEHSHHWHIAQRLNKACDSEPQRAFVAGYFTHLAADTVAHNIYVPEQLNRRQFFRNMGHAYWEFRAEKLISLEIRDALQNLIDRDFSDEKKLIESEISVTIFPFPINWSIMNGVIQISSNESWHNFLDFWDQFTDEKLCRNQMDEYFDLCLKRMKESIEDPSDTNRIHFINPADKGSRFYLD